MTVSYTWIVACALPLVKGLSYPSSVTNCTRHTSGIVYASAKCPKGTKRGETMRGQLACVTTYCTENPGFCTATPCSCKPVLFQKFTGVQQSGKTCYGCESQVNPFFNHRTHVVLFPCGTCCLVFTCLPTLLLSLLHTHCVVVWPALQTGHRITIEKIRTVCPIHNTVHTGSGEMLHCGLLLPGRIAKNSNGDHRRQASHCTFFASV